MTIKELVTENCYTAFRNFLDAAEIEQPIDEFIMDGDLAEISDADINGHIDRQIVEDTFFGIGYLKGLADAWDCTMLQAYDAAMRE